MSGANASRRGLLLGGLALAGSALCPAADRAVKRLAVISPEWHAAGKDRYARSFEPLGYRLGDNLDIAWLEFPVRSNWDVVVPRLVEQAVRWNPDCIFTSSVVFTSHVQKATRTIPIVTVILDADPVALGFARSLARPGGNITGIHGGFAEVNTKRIEFLRQLVPGLSCVGWIAFRQQLAWFGQFESLARDAGLRVRAIVPNGSDAPGFEDTKREVAKLRREGCLAAHFHTSIPELVEAVAAAALENRIALSYDGEDASVARDGIMFQYRSLVYASGYQAPTRSVSMIARIFRGERPENMPFEGPVGYDLLLNVRTARRIGVTVPPDILTLARDIFR